MSHAEAGTSSNVNVTIGGVSRKTSTLLRMLRARNRDALPAILAGRELQSDPVVAGQACFIGIPRKEYQIPQRYGRPRARPVSGCARWRCGRRRRRSAKTEFQEP